MKVKELMTQDNKSFGNGGYLKPLMRIGGKPNNSHIYETPPNTARLAASRGAVRGAPHPSFRRALGSHLHPIC
jgi:hypothetical protein